jgi:hypothetical protein
MKTSLPLASIAVVLGLFACSHERVDVSLPTPTPTPDPGPPRICRTPTPSDGPWYTEITSEVGLAKTDKLEPLATNLIAADVDGDGWIDVYAAVFPAQREPVGTKRTRFLFMNRPDPKNPGKRVFVDEIDASGLLATRDGEGGRGLTSISFGDLDNDGDLDAVGCAGFIDLSIKDGCAAYLNDGKGHFTLAPQAGDLEKDIFASGSAAMLDYDRDGILDYWPATIGKWQYGPAPVSRMRFYRGNGDGTFQDVSADVGLPQNLTGGADYRMIFGVTSCDIDLDGDRDVILAEYGVEDGANHVYRNDGGKFVDIGKELGVRKGPKGQGGFTFGITCGDLDDNGTIDLFVAELQHAWYPDTDFSEALMNYGKPGDPLQPYTRPGRAAMGLDRPHVGSAWTEGDQLAQFADLDLDGHKDIYLVSVNYPQQSASDPDWTHSWLYHQKADGTFEDFTGKTPWGDKGLQSLGSSVLADIDNDGDLDVITGTETYNSEFLKLTNTIHVFRNEIGQDSNLARIRVVGKGAGFSNVSGIGARVEIVSGGRTQQQEVLGSWASTQNDVYLTFGLGEACDIDKVIVHWPDAAGTTTTYEHVAANYLLEIREGESAVSYKNLDGSKLTIK